MDELSLARAALEAPRDLALVAGGEALTFAALAERAARARGAMLAAGAGPGSRVALLARNGADTVLTLLAVLDLGATLVPIHPRLTEAEAQILLDDAAPALTLREADLPALAGDPAPAFAAPGSPAAILYTSGTTGRPKGAVLSRRAFLASAAASAENIRLSSNDRWLLAMPLCHVGGLSIVTRCLAARRPVVLLPRFDADEVLAAISRDRATLLSVVPTMLAALLDRDRENVLARLRAVLVGGAGAPFSLLEACGRRGVRAITTYGLTEACSQVTVQRLAPEYAPARGSGTPLPGVELSVTRDDGAPAAAGEVGRLRVRGPTLMDGYFRGPGRDPDPARDAAGFFDTGDLGELDERGALHVHARRSDLIVTGGENVYPVEVEERLEALPGVRRALVFGVPDPRWGQLVACAIELAEGASLDAVTGLFRDRLAPHKRPRLACAVAALPLTGSGKLDRARAAERYGEALRRL